MIKTIGAACKSGRQFAQNSRLFLEERTHRSSGLSAAHRALYSRI
jgi:hypothetical protein